jgi:adenylate kinase
VQVVLLGSPGAGKGTHAKYLEAEFGMEAISTGDILRQAVAERSPLGRQAEAYMSRGALVPDGLMLDLIRERLRSRAAGQSFVLDGFPRTIAQAKGLERLLEELGTGLDAALLLEVAREVVIERLGGRRLCRRCSAVYHVAFAPPREPGVCDRCGGELYQREDDRPEKVAARLEVFERETAPLIDYYEDRGLLRRVDAAGRVEEVRARLLEELGLKDDRA